MDEILKFDRVYYEKYNTSRINIENGILVVRRIVRPLRLIKRNMVITPPPAGRGVEFAGCRPAEW